MTVATLQALGRAADRHPRPARGPRPARPRPPARPCSTRTAASRTAARGLSPDARAAHDALRRQRLDLIQAAPRPPAPAGPAGVRARRAGRRRPPRRRVRRAGPRGPPAGQRRAAPRGHDRGLRPALRGRPLGAGAAGAGRPDARAAGRRRSPSWPTAAADLERLADETREVAYCLRNLGRDWDDDPARLEEVEARLALYRRLAARFHCAPDDLAARRAEVEATARRHRARRGRPARPRRPAGASLGRGDRGRGAASPRRGGRRARRSPRRSRGGSSRSASAGARLAVEVETAAARRRPDRRRRPRRRGSTASRSSSRPTRARPPGRSARSPRGASCRG